MNRDFSPVMHPSPVRAEFGLLVAVITNFEKYTRAK